ncbi:MAG: hypothetical protein E7813_22300 [Bradyrhizobium sp.]|nr:hypothetical protein [Bradyrhizobium sp.]THD60931.1 MAG: hypothetical protein E7813_22300 [Bradyrhizobium sp.]
MGRALLVSAVLLVTLGPNPVTAGPRSLPASPPTGFETYRGYGFDLSENAERKDVGAMATMLRRQLDIVEDAGFSPKVLQFFHSVPIIASEMACLDESAAAACYGSSVPARMSSGVTTWDEVKHRWTNSDMVELAADTGIGVVMLRPNMMRYEQDPVVLHELLHAYHAKLMPHGYENMGINNFYSEAQKKNLFGKDEYVLKNSREFFAVTASIFLAGKDSEHAPHNRAKLKELMPDYYKYLVGVFGFDPDAPGVIPVASAN